MFRQAESPILSPLGVGEGTSMAVSHIDLPTDEERVEVEGESLALSGVASGKESEAHSKGDSRGVLRQAEASSPRALQNPLDPARILSMLLMMQPFLTSSPNVRAMVEPLA
ncbi:hypothetical protein GUJ93_ZPchr0012g19553 [Zizania palustris]|uniref:Uncharacterized protein n=1 Tax=Zizania palustris TaxID=103762 RepID=A0A8J5WHU4_ZIZPA|nr:hypothetical protein GUJ93_ZPchr0012g19553 [Zizania palustris]